MGAAANTVPGQESLFSGRVEKKDSEDPILKEISELELDNLTPLNALSILYELKKKIVGREEP